MPWADSWAIVRYDAATKRWLVLSGFEYRVVSDETGRILFTGREAIAGLQGVEVGDGGVLVDLSLIGEVQRFDLASFESRVVRTVAWVDPELHAPVDGQELTPSPRQVLPHAEHAVFGNQLVRANDGSLVRRLNLPWPFDERRWRAAESMVSSPDGCRLAFNQDSTLPSRSVVLDASSPNYRLEPLGRVYAVLASHKVVVYGGAADKLAVLSEQGNLLGRVSVPHAPMRSSAFAVLAGTSPDSFAAWDPASGDLGLFDGASSVGFVRREAPTADVSALDTTMEATFCAQPQALLTWHRPRTQNRSGWPADFTTVRARDTTTGEVMAEFSCPQGGFMPYEARCSGAGTVFVTYVGGAAALFDDEGNVRTFYRPRKGPPPTI